MNPFDASDPDIESVLCAVCDRTIIGGQWAGRFKQEEWMVALCCPSCLEAFTHNPLHYVRLIEKRLATRRFSHPDQSTRE